MIEPEVYCISDVTGWLTQMPRSEAIRKRLDFADTPEGLGRVVVVKPERTHYDPRTWNGEWGAWRDLSEQERLNPQKKTAAADEAATA